MPYKSNKYSLLFSFRQPSELFFFSPAQETLVKDKRSEQHWKKNDISMEQECYCSIAEDSVSELKVILSLSTCRIPITGSDLNTILLSLLLKVYLLRRGSQWWLCDIVICAIITISPLPCAVCTETNLFTFDLFKNNSCLCGEREKNFASCNWDMKARRVGFLQGLDCILFLNIQGSS